MLSALSPSSRGGALVWKSTGGSLSVVEGVTGQGLIWRTPGIGKCVSRGAARKASALDSPGEDYRMAK